MFESIKIIDGKIKANIYIGNKTIYVCSNSNIDINKYFNILKSFNIEDLIKRSESTILYKGKGKKKRKRKIHLLEITFVLSVAAIALVNALDIDQFRIISLSPDTVQMDNYTTNDLYHFINSSPLLTEEEKRFIYNEDFLNDVLETINDDDYLKYMYSINFNNIKIESFDEEQDKMGHAFGYYDTDYPSTLFIRNYEKLTDTKKDTVAHEFIHLCQDVSGYNLIIEASAEIISSEYYNTPISCYQTQVKLLKKLMEIIGPEPIWIYNFTGDFSLIKEKVKPYLTDEEYMEFLDDLTFDYDDYTKNIPKFDSLESLLAKLYTAKYGTDINENKIISLISDGDRTLSRYYFNSRFINVDNSYYLSYEEGEYLTLSLERAIDSGLVQIYSINRTPLEREEAFSLIQTGNYSIERIIDYKSADIRIYKTTYEHSKMYITGYVNDKKYENYDVDLLVTDGIIQVNYYLVNLKLLSADDYLSHNYEEDSTIEVFHSEDTQFNEETVYGFVPKKIYIPPTSRIDEKPKTITMNYNN